MSNIKDTLSLFQAPGLGAQKRNAPLTTTEGTSPSQQHSTVKSENEGKVIVRVNFSKNDSEKK